ncbi:ATP-grasp domain-containing protein [Niastella vici]|nr:hypothetical protein [Niastella vici]
MKQVLIIGFPGDNTIYHILNIATMGNYPFRFLNLKAYYENGYIESANTTDPEVVYNFERFCLKDFSGIYQRLSPPLPEKYDSINYMRAMSRYKALHYVLLATKLKIINPINAGWDNASKPFQTYLLMKHGFKIPTSMSTSIPSDFEQFNNKFISIYKSNSSTRSIVDVTQPQDSSRKETLINAPVFFQQYISGKDVRIHIFNDKAFAVEIKSDAIDYRYYKKKGTYSNMKAIDNTEAPKLLINLCISYAKERRIVLAGFDFKVTETNEWHCLEMNPMPGYDSYDRVLGNAISIDILNHLLS